MKITEDELERLVAGLFGDNLTTGNIVFINEDDEFIETRDLDEAIEFDPTHISLETTKGELVGFAMADEDVPAHFPEASMLGKGFEVFFFESPEDGMTFDREIAFVEIPLVTYEINSENFYKLSDFDAPPPGKQQAKSTKATAKAEKAVEPTGPSIDMDAEVIFGMAASAARGDGAWKNIPGTLRNVVEMLTLHQEGKKDGQCFLQGELAGNGRSAKAMIRNHLIGFDLDTGETAEEIDERLADTGYAYVRYTTHSHMKDSSEVKRDAFFRWSGQDATKSVNPSTLKRYLVEVKGFVPRVLENLEIVDDAKVSEEGVLTLIRHSKMPKHRIIFFLNEPFVFQGKANQTEEIKAWKEHYHGLGIHLGFVYDKSCTDPARLFYLPRHAKDAPFDTRFVNGDYVDLRSYERVEMKRDTNTQSVNQFQDAAKSLGATSEGLYANSLNLKRWIMTRDCDIVDLIEEYYPDAIKTPRTNGPGFHIECPFEDEHTRAGGTGTFAINASDNEKGFHIHCTHDSCAGRNKLDYIKRMVELEWFDTDALQDERFCPSLLREEPESSDDDEDEKNVENFNVHDLIETVSKDMAKDDVIEILRRISRRTDVDQEDFESHLGRISRRSKIPKKTLQKHVTTNRQGAASEEERAEKLDEMDRRLHEYNKRYAMVDTGSKVVIMDANKKDMTFTNRDDWKALKANEKILIVEGENREPKLESIAKVWLEWEQRRTYEGVTFDPRPNPEPNKFNLFNGFETVARKGKWDKMQNHIYEVMCHSNEAHYQWIITWMAQIVQCPWEKKGSAIVVRGKKGVGKSIVFSALKDILGKYAMSSANASHITGQFNWHFRDKLFMIAEEGLFAGNAREDSILKELITGTSLLMEPKGIDAFSMENYLRLAIISNEEWVVNASADERRYFVLEASDKYKGDLKYFNAIIEQMDSGGREAMMYDLLHFEPQTEAGWNILREPPMTDALSEQVNQSTHVWEKFFITFVENMGIHEYSSELEPINLSYGETTLVDPKELQQYYYNSLRTTTSKYKADPKTFQKLAKHFLKAQWVKKKMGQAEGLWMRLPPLEEITDHLQNNLKIKLEMIEILEE